MFTNPQTGEASNNLAGSFHGLPAQTAPLFDRASERAGALAQRGLDAVRDSSQKLRDQAQRASDGTRSYIRDEPLKSMLFAAATGAALVALLSLLGSSRYRR